MSSKYVMGFTDSERRRLALQGQILNPLTEAFLERAGLKAGMHVLDLGSGIGDVSLIAAKLVGPRGSVTGIDQDCGSLDIARSRAGYAGLDHVKFEQADLDHHHSEHRYDGVIGWHILIHVEDP